jgi:hypothetical protein
MALPTHKFILTPRPDEHNQFFRLYLVFFNIIGLQLLSRIFLFLFITLCIAGCGDAGDDVIATVGESVITRSDLHYQIQTEQVYGFDSIQPYMALVQLVNAAFESEAARHLAIYITPEMVASYAAHVDENTRDREKLEKIKSIFGADSAAYTNVFLKPRMLNITNRDTYVRVDSIHAAKRELAGRVHNLTMIYPDFRDIAPLTESVFEDHLIDSSAMPVNYAPDENEQVIFFASPFYPFADQLEPGQVFPDIIDSGTAFTILKLIERKTGGVLRIHLLTVAKDTFDQYLSGIINTTAVAVADEDLLEQLKANYPTLNWVQSAGELKE